MRLPMTCIVKPAGCAKTPLWRKNSSKKHTFAPGAHWKIYATRMRQKVGCLPSFAVSIHGNLNASIRPKMENIEQVPEFVAVTQFKTDTESFVLRSAMAELAIEYREPLVSQVIGGFSCDEIAEIMGVTKSTVMTRVFRAHKKLRDRLIGIEPKKALES